MDRLDQLAAFLEQKFNRQIRAHHVLDPVPGVFADFPPALHARLRRVLEEQGITRLYAHQAAAFDHINAAEDTLLVSRTASGKTLSFLLPILNRYLTAQPPFSVLMLYPTKALSRDQEGTLGKLLDAAAGTRHFGVFDGDTPREERQQIQRTADFVITNPDMLHAGILPNHNRAWKSFLARLQYIVVDEVHTYRGAFGSHVSNVFRRLLRICEQHGSRPTFIGCSATVGNPAEHVQALFHRPFHVIDRDGAPRPQRDLYLHQSAAGAERGLRHVPQGARLRLGPAAAPGRGRGGAHHLLLPRPPGGRTAVSVGRGWSSRTARRDQALPRRAPAQRAAPAWNATCSAAA
jgi:DEAD/DEAH box helicase domain-containing protein